MRINCRILEVYAKIFLYFTSTFLLLTFYLPSTLTLLNICTRQGKVLYRSRQGAALPSLRYDEMPFKGNMTFPPWEYIVEIRLSVCREIDGW